MVCQCCFLFCLRFVSSPIYLSIVSGITGLFDDIVTPQCPTVVPIASSRPNLADILGQFYSVCHQRRFCKRTDKIPFPSSCSLVSPKTSIGPLQLEPERAANRRPSRSSPGDIEQHYPNRVFLSFAFIS